MFKQEERPNYFETILKLFIILVVSVLVFVSPFLLYANYAATGLIMYFVALILLSPSVAFTYKNLIYFKKNEVKNALTSSKTYVGTLAILNCFVFFTIGFDTLLPTFWLGVFYFVTHLSVYFFFKSKLSLAVTIFSEVLISLFLLINYYTVEKTTSEKYRYYINRSNSTIYLENNQYEEFFGIRVFWINQEVSNFNKIYYEIGEGVLGVKVVKAYNFKPKKTK